jgi:hypothetical protein
MNSATDDSSDMPQRQPSHFRSGDAMTVDQRDQAAGNGADCINVATRRQLIESKNRDL